MQPAIEGTHPQPRYIARSAAVLALWIATAVPAGAQVPAVIRVGPGGQVATIAEAAALAGDGDTVEVQAGDYVGNLIEQGLATQNRTIVSFGAEGYRWPVNELSMAHNTVVNRTHGAATMVRAAPGPASTVILNNLWVGGGTLDLPVATKEGGNLAVTIHAFRDAPRYDFRPAASSTLRPDAARLPAALTPGFQYVHERRVARLTRGPLFAGAFQR